MKTRADSKEVEAYQKLASTLRHVPIPDNQILAHLPLFLTRVTVAHLLFMDQLYRQILPVHGDILEFGVRWGRNLSLLLSLRNLHEPHNYARRVFGFDTFEGFSSLGREDGDDEVIQMGRLAVSPGWETVLEDILSQQEQLAPRPELRRFGLVKGDVMVTFPEWLAAHPESIVALAYFDMDVYKPTKAALEALLPRLVKGSVIAFDELCLSEFPGETQALREVLDINRHRLVRSPLSGNQSYIVFDGL